MSPESEACLYPPCIDISQIWVRSLPPVHRSVPDSGQGFQTLGRCFPILIRTVIVARTFLSDAGQVAVTYDPGLRKQILEFVIYCTIFLG